MSVANSTQEWVFLSPKPYPEKIGVVEYIDRVAAAMQCNLPSARVVVATVGDEDENIEQLNSPYIRFSNLQNWTDSELAKLHHFIQNDSPNRIVIPYAPGFYGGFWSNSLQRFIRARKTLGDEVSIIFYHSFSGESRSYSLRSGLFFLATLLESAKLRSMLKLVDRLFLLSVTHYGHLNYIIPSSVPVLSLPVPSNLHCKASDQQARNLRKALAQDLPLVIGTYGSFREQSQKQFLDELIPSVLQARAEVIWICMGRRSEAYVEHLKSKHIQLASRIQQAGELDEKAISAHLKTCDLLVQPYPNGVSTSRTSVMAGLHHGIPVVTSAGRKTEQIWRNSAAVALVPWPKTRKTVEKILQLLDDPVSRQELAERGARLYQANFSLEKLCSILEQPMMANS